MKFGDFAQITPKVVIPKNVEVSFVEMADLSPGIRTVESKITKLLKGSGAKFCNHDTLFSRITPCLQNGKISQVKYLKNGIGFGSTEFFVFRGKEGVSTSDFVYYLSQSEQIKEPAIKSMVGASGRQRADLDVIRNIDVVPFNIEQQIDISTFLSNYDNLIENNNRRIAILEDMAQSLYREWFVNFRYPGHADAVDKDGNQKLIDSPLGQIPEGWGVMRLDEIADVNPESITKKNTPESIGYIDIKSVGAGIINEVKPMLFKDAPSRARRIVIDEDIIWATVRPNRKQFSYICKPNTNTIASTGFAVLRSKNVPSSYLYSFTTTESFTSYLVNHATGSAYPAVNADIFQKANVLLPPIKLLEDFDELSLATMRQSEALKKKNKNLKQQRDMLLPKLISGQIELKD
jgi:type I restriction enzyme S subunit